MLQKFQNHIQTKFPQLLSSKLLLAVSGGMDSMVLLYLCHQLQLNFAVAHCNFQLRGDESDGDEQFVTTICKALHIPVFSEKFIIESFANQQNTSVQTVARKLRYEWFDSLLEKNQFDFLLTAHHQDDNLETFFINFLRGTGLDGLTGIPEIHHNIIRPLLIFSRNEIKHFSLEHKILFREDSSNESTKYLRNKIRLEVVPKLKEWNPQLLFNFENTLLHLSEAQSLVEDASKLVFQEVCQISDEQIIISIPKLLHYPNYNAYLYQWLKDFGFRAWDDVYHLVEAQSGKQVFSATHGILKNREELIVFKNEKEPEKQIYFIEKGVKNVKIPLKLSICKVNDIQTHSSTTIFVDEDLLQFPLTIRKWEEGDSFYPTGMVGKKKVSKFFKDEKYSIIDKKNCWLLLSKNDIIWIIGKRQDKRFLPNPATQSILQINI